MPRNIFQSMFLGVMSRVSRSNATGHTLNCGRTRSDIAALCRVGRRRCAAGSCQAGTSVDCTPTCITVPDSFQASHVDQRLFALCVIGFSQ